jgi:hypothetical protein
MKTIDKLALLILVAGIVLVTGCNKNYYSGSGKGGKNCGCPSHKRMSGY